MTSSLSHPEVSVAQPPAPAGNGGVLAEVLERTKTFSGPAIGVALLVVCALMLSGGGFIATLLEDMLIYAIAAMALDFLGGYAGLISLEQAGFLGLGAYGFAIAEVHSFSPVTAIAVSLGVVLGVAAVTGIVAVRVSGISFAIITLALGQIFWGLAYQWVALSEGDNGVSVLQLPKIGPLDLNSASTLRFVVLGVFVVVAVVLQVFVRSPFGLSLRGLRSNETRMRALGYRTGLHRYLAYVIACFIAGIAGILFVFVNRLMSPTSMAFSQDGLLVLIVVLGGLGSIWGPAIGSIVVVLFQQELSIYVTRWQTVMGLVFIAVVVFSPGGVWGAVRAFARRRDSYLARRNGGAATADRTVGEPDAVATEGIAVLEQPAVEGPSVP